VEKGRSPGAGDVVATGFKVLSIRYLPQMVRIGQNANRIKMEMSISRSREPEVLLTPAEVAKLFRVDPKTVTRWAKAGKLTAIRTLGGHRRYRRSEVELLLTKPENRG
jgi:excisionase family DNA binding protein